MDLSQVLEGVVEVSGDQRLERACSWERAQVLSPNKLDLEGRMGRRFQWRNIWYGHT